MTDENNQEISELKNWEIRAKAKQKRLEDGEITGTEHLKLLGYDPEAEDVTIYMQKKYCPILYWDNQNRCYTVGKLVESHIWAGYETYAVPGVFTHHTHNTNDRFINLIFGLNVDKNGEYLPEPDELYSVECSILKNVNEP